MIYIPLGLMPSYENIPIKDLKSWTENLEMILPALSQDCLLRRLSLTGNEDKVYHDILSIRHNLAVAESRKSLKHYEKIHNALNSLWFHLADNRAYLTSIPYFFILCDLCSEVWVFDELREE